MLTRRDLLKLGLVGSGYVILGPDGKVSPADDLDDLRSPSSTPFIDELPLPPVATPLLEPFLDIPQQYKDRWVDDTTDFFKIVAEQRKVSFHSGWPFLTTIWGYRDACPEAGPTRGAGTLKELPHHIFGPTLVQLFGELSPRIPRIESLFGTSCGQKGPFPVGGGMVVRHINCLPKDHRGFGVPRLSVHLHGGHHLARADGFPGNIENRPGNLGNADIPDGFPCFVVMEPPGFVPDSSELLCATPPNLVSELCPADGRHVTERQILDYYYPVLDVGVLDRLEGHCDTKIELTERPSTQWYHDHFLDFTGPNAYRGLAGFVLGFDEHDRGDEENVNSFQLPSAPFDIPLAIQDKRFSSRGELVYSSFDHDGFIGDKFLVNGAIQPYLDVQRRKYRFRFLNASNARIYQLFLTNSDPKTRDAGDTFPMTEIAVEGGLLSRPLTINSFMIAMAERVEVVIDFSRFAEGTRLYIENKLFQEEGRRPDGLRSRGELLLEFRVGGLPARPDPSQVPSRLREFEPISEEEIATAVRRSFRFDRSHGAWTINGELAGHLEHPVATPRRNRGEIWRLENNSGGWWHPIHIHSEFFRVIKRNGQKPRLLAEQDGIGKKDTILLRDNESVEVFLKFRDHLGPFVFHCHNMEHEDMQMMARFDVVP